MTITGWNNVILSDDDLEDCEIFADVLSQVHGEAVLTTVNNGHELMQLLNRPPHPLPDIIFLDLNMPMKSGYECLAEIRRTKGMENYVVVIFTTTNLAKDIDMLYGMGANLFITKPTDYNKLKDMLQKIFKGEWLHKLVQQPPREEFAWQ